jgi:DNA-binding FadR family transcriptional regulator
VREAFQRTNWHLHIYRQHYHRGIGPQALAEHRRIADAVLACDPAAAADAMRAHLEQSHARLREETHDGSR